MSSVCRITILFIAVYTVLFSPAYAKDTHKILIFGDSIVAGYGLKKADAIPERIEVILREAGHDVDVINGGVSGDTTAAGRNRLNWTLKKHNPTLVVLALGGNDMLRGLPPKISRENIFAMMETLNNNNEITTILSAVQAPSNLGLAYAKQFNTIYTDAADEFNTPLYPFLLEPTFGNNQLMLQDGIHPSPAGAKIIAEKLATYLKEFL